jgi:hypothetical protein
MATASPREAEDVFTIDHVDPVETVDVSGLSAAEPSTRPDLEAADEHAIPATPTADVDVTDAYVTVWRTDAVDHADAVDGAEPAHTVEYRTAPAVSGRGVIVASLVASLLCAAADCALTGTLTMFFDLCFITICLVGAMGVRRADLFTTSVLAPLALAAVVLLVSVGVPDAFGPGGLSRVFFIGLAAHAGALVCGYGVALAVVAGRVAAARSSC